MSTFVLEKYRVFPYIAWSLVICFSVFVLHLTQTLAKVTNDLNLAQAQLETDVATPIKHLETSTTTSHKK